MHGRGGYELGLVLFGALFVAIGVLERALDVPGYRIPWYACIVMGIAIMGIGAFLFPNRRPPGFCPRCNRMRTVHPVALGDTITWTCTKCGGKAGPPE